MEAPPHEAANTGPFSKITPRPLQAIMADLHKPVPRRLTESKVQGGTEITFIPWHQACRLMDLYAPGWSGTVKSIQVVTAPDKKGDRKDLVVITYRVSIPCTDDEGNLVIIDRESTGWEDFTNQSWGDPFSNAESMAKRRAFAQFGLGQHLYRKEI